MPINFGTIEGAKEEISRLHEIFKALGPYGTLKLESLPREADIKISDSISISLKTPFAVAYRFENNSLKLEFHKPYPIGRFKNLMKAVPYMEIAMDHINIGLDWSPDGRLEVLS